MDQFHALSRAAAGSRVVPEIARIGTIAAGLGLSAAGINQIMQMRREAKAREKVRAHKDRAVTVFGKQANLPEFLAGAMRGQYATAPHHFPLFIPAAGLTAGAAGAAGYLGGSKLLSSIREAQNKRRLEKARQEYLQALQPTPVSRKAAEERCDLAKDMDRLYAHFQGYEKAASYTPELSRTLGTVAGLYLLAATGTMGYGALKGFQSQRANSKTKAVERARLERQLVKEKDQPSVVTVGKP